MTSSADFEWAPVLKRSAWVSIVVGTLLNVINQPDAVFGDADFGWGKALLTYLVPFGVATYGAYYAMTANNKTQ